MKATAESQFAQDHAAALEVLHAESRAIEQLAERLDPEVIGRAVDILVAAKGQVVLTGMGKSGHIARKIAATLASTGTPAFFMHPGEAVHGDLGMLTSQNPVVALSNSGSTDELVNLLPYIRQLSIPLIALTGNSRSPLAKQADVVLATDIDQEACPLNLAPTNSTTVQLAMGDALAIAVMKRRGFTPEDFALRHPLGTLGKRLLVHVRDLMHSGDTIPIVYESAPIHRAINNMTNKRLGSVIVVDDSGRMTGIFCDGDLRRLFDEVQGQIDGNAPISEAMIRNPKFTTPETLGVKAVDMMETYKITVLPVCDADHHPVGLIHLHDLIQAGIAR